MGGNSSPLMAVTVLRVLSCALATTSALNIVALGGSKAVAKSTPTAARVPEPKIFDPVAQIFENDHDTLDLDDHPYQNAKDKYLAARDRKTWCADRCLATGHCDVLEDIYELTTAQVMKFCEACSGDDECSLSYAN